MKEMQAHEPKEAFPYKPPSQELKEKYDHIFKLNKAPKERLIKKLLI